MANTNTLGLTGAFSYRLATFGLYVGTFYVLIALGLPGLAALGLVVGSGMVVLCVQFVRLTHFDIVDSIMNAVIVGILASGILVFVVLDEHRSPRGSLWGERIFISSLSEAAFFLSVFGIFGEMVADPVEAVLVGLATLLAQALILADPTVLWRGMPDAKGR